MKSRLIAVDVLRALERQVALSGPRQAGKTTLALDIAKRSDAVYLDLESSENRVRLERVDIVRQGW